MLRAGIPRAPNQAVGAVQIGCTRTDAATSSRRPQSAIVADAGDQSAVRRNSRSRTR
jgi:hypothetical protein